MGWGQGVHSESEDNWAVSSSVMVSKNSVGIDIPLGKGIKSCLVSDWLSLGAGTSLLLTCHLLEFSHMALQQIPWETET